MTIGPRDLDVRQGLVSFGEASGQRMKCSWYKKICSWLATSLVGDISGGGYGDGKGHSYCVSAVGVSMSNGGRCHDEA